MKIGVIAGTPVDTQMGVDYILSKGCDAVGRACSENPEKQTEMQVLHKEELAKLVVKLCNEMISEGASGIFVNCNSLSGAIDLNYVRANLSVKVVTPLDVYAECASSFKSLSVIAANGQSLAAIEKVIMSKNSSCLVFGAGILPLVIAIEAGKNPHEIYNDLKIKLLTDSLVAMGCDALVLGCTHFPYVLEDIENNITVPVINPSDRMLEMLKN